MAGKQSHRKFIFFIFDEIAIDEIFSKWQTGKDLKIVYVAMWHHYSPILRRIFCVPLVQQYRKKVIKNCVA